MPVVFCASRGGSLQKGLDSKLQMCYNVFVTGCVMQTLDDPTKETRDEEYRS